jgi:hypothetical protein
VSTSYNTVDKTSKLTFWISPPNTKNNLIEFIHMELGFNPTVENQILLKINVIKS